MIIVTLEHSDRRVRQFNSQFNKRETGFFL